MEMTGEYRIPAARERVWQALNDPATLKLCIPGCESLEKVSDTEMTAVARMRVGPVSARFSGKVTLSEIDPPNGYRITGEGQGGAAGFAKGGAAVKLTGEGAETVLTYTAEAQVGGKLAQIGSRLIDGAAKKMADEFFAKFAETLGGGDGGAAPPQSTAGSSASSSAMASVVAAGPMTTAQAAAHNAAAALVSASRGYRHWAVIGLGVIVVLIVHYAVR